MNAWVSLALSTALGTVGGWLANHAPKSEFIEQNQIIVGVLIASLTLFSFNSQKFVAYVRLYSVANIRGLWGNKALNDVLTKDYSGSSCLDIKVTRGFGLFLKDDGIFKKLILQQKGKKQRRIRILLHYPCLESDHIRRRATANNKSLNDYIEDLFKVLKELYTHSDDEHTGETITVKFYISDKDSEWRFYVFEDENGKKTLYFNHYDDSMSGAKSRMLRVLEGQHSLCDELKQTFDKMFDNASFEVVENHSSPRLLNQDRCGHPSCEAKIQQTYHKYFRS